ncbi:MAG: SPOR domain-containing protein [Bacteroidales bacterium]|nr:SPOR domain-containing protein [Bacteroidales bacterium]
MRNYHSKVIFLILFLSLTFWVDAQTSRQKNEILKELNSRGPGKGNVTVYEDESIKQILGRPMGPPRTIYSDAEGSVQYYKMRGFKIQAFSGNDQRTSRDEANRKQSLITNQYPDHEAVVLFETPFWRLRVGNFQSRPEAEAALQQLRESFPSFGKEMYIVVDEVKIPVN